MEILAMLMAIIIGLGLAEMRHRKNQKNYKEEEEAKARKKKELQAIMLAPYKVAPRNVEGFITHFGKEPPSIPVGTKIDYCSRMYIQEPDGKLSDYIIKNASFDPTRKSWVWGKYMNDFDIVAWRFSDGHAVEYDKLLSKSSDKVTKAPNLKMLDLLGDR